MPSRFDGGRIALAGFLYQMLAIHSLRVDSDAIDVAEGDDGLTASLLPTRDSGDIIHEPLQQDAAVRIWRDSEDVDEYTLIQFKYSLRTPPTPISKGDMREIAEHFTTSAGQARARGLTVRRYHLITNRHLTTPASSLTRDFAPSDSDTEVFANLSVAQRIPLDMFEQLLIKFGRQFGERDDKIARGISELIGALIRRTVTDGEPFVTREAIIEAFTGTSAAQMLTRSAIRPQIIEGIARFRATVGLGDYPIRRKLIEEIAASARERALVVVVGGGGCGKSVALWQWADEIRESSGGEGAPPVALSTARLVRRSWPTELLCAWGNYPPGHIRFNDRESDVVDRLRLVNDRIDPPFLFLALDGLDEDLGGAGQRHNVEELVRWFVGEDVRAHRHADPPVMTLVVTCRDSRQFWREFCRDDVSGFRTDDELGFAKVIVNTFSDNELLLAVRGATPRFSERIESALRLARGGRLPTFLVDEPVVFGGDSGMRPVDEQVLEALKHPAMWRTFLLLTGSNQQDRALDGEADSRREMARLFVGRFIAKALDRGRAGELDERALLRLLCHIARCTCGTGRDQHTFLGWIEPACTTQMVDWMLADRLLREALSGGILDGTIETSWRWRHKFVEIYLAETDLLQTGGG